MRYNDIDELTQHIIEEINDIIQEADATSHPIYASFAHQPSDHSYNDITYNTADPNLDGFFLLVDGWDDVEQIGSALLARQPFIRDEPYCDLGDGSDRTAYGYIIDLFLEGQWGFEDEYSTCSSCGCPIRYDLNEHLVENGEITCFDCLDDEYYVEEYLPYTVNIADELASQEHEGVRINLKLEPGQLEDFGYEPYRQELAVGMYEKHYDDPQDIIANAEDGYTYIVSPPSIASFGRNPFEQEYEVWRRPLDY